MMELAFSVAACEHYSLNGYEISLQNPAGNIFVIKSSTRGEPSKYSRFVVTKGNYTCEIHMNLMVRSAQDDGIYCVDLGIVPVEKVPTKTNKSWKCLENSDLITFVESKKLAIYPMLIAQFIGIVHEIKPIFLAEPLSDEFISQCHFPPSLASLGRFSGNSQSIVKAFPKRKRNISIQILDNFDVRLSNVRRGKNISAFETTDASLQKNNNAENIENSEIPFDQIPF